MYPQAANCLILLFWDMVKIERNTYVCVYSYVICFSLNNVVYLKSNHVDEPNCPSFTFTTVHSIIVKLNIFESPFPGSDMYFHFLKCCFVSASGMCKKEHGWFRFEYKWFRFESLSFSLLVASYLTSLSLSFHI